MAGLPGINVALPAKATQTVASGLVRSTQAIGSSLVTSGFFIALCTAAYVLVRKFVTAYRQNQLLKQVGTGSADGLAVGYAQRSYTAMISGYAWWNDLVGDGTDEEALYQVAREMKTNNVPFALVAGKYKTLYNRELLTDLTNELDTTQMRKYQAALATGMNGLGASPSVHHWLVTTAPTPVLDDQLRVLGELPARMRLGEHTHSLFGADGQAWHGFDYRDQVRFVPAAAVGRIPY